MSKIDIELARREYQNTLRRRQFEGRKTGQVQDSSDLPDGSIRVFVPDLRSFVIAYGAQYRIGVWVWLEELSADEWHITSVNVKNSVDTFGSDYLTATQTSFDGEATATLWGMRNLKPGNVIPSPDSLGSLKVWILGFDHEGGRFITQELDLESYLPTNAGEVQWAKIGVDTATNTPIVSTGTVYLYPINELLPIEDLHNIDLGTKKIDIEGVTLRYGQTDISQSRFESMRRLLNANAAFTLTGDSGSVTLENGDTLIIAGGTGLESTVSGDTATLNLSNTTVVPGAYTNADITVDTQGRITAATNGSSSGGASAFNDLSDVPATYTGAGTYLVAVKSDETGLEFISPASGSGNTITRGAYASLPGSAATAGDMYICTDAPYMFVWTGSVWAARLDGVEVTPPASYTWAWDNQGGASVVENGDVLLAGDAVSGQNFRVRYKSAPSVPYVVTVRLDWDLYSTNYHGAGICFRESSSGAMNIFFIQIEGGTPTWRNMTMANSTSGESPVQAFSIFNVGLNNCPLPPILPQWLRIEDDNTNRLMSISTNGRDWRQVFNMGRTTTLTADQVGFFVSAKNTSYAPRIRVLGWTES